MQQKLRATEVFNAHFTYRFSVASQSLVKKKNLRKAPIAPLVVNYNLEVGFSFCAPSIPSRFAYNRARNDEARTLHFPR